MTIDSILNRLDKEGIEFHVEEIITKTNNDNITEETTNNYDDEGSLCSKTIQIECKTGNIVRSSILIFNMNYEKGELEMTSADTIEEIYDEFGFVKEMNSYNTVKSEENDSFETTKSTLSCRKLFTDKNGKYSRIIEVDYMKKSKLLYSRFELYTEDEPTVPKYKVFVVKDRETGRYSITSLSIIKDDYNVIYLNGSYEITISEYNGNDYTYKKYSFNNRNIDMYRKPRFNSEDDFLNLEKIILKDCEDGIITDSRKDKCIKFITDNNDSISIQNKSMIISLDDNNTSALVRLNYKKDIPKFKRIIKLLGFSIKQ